MYQIDLSQFEQTEEKQPDNIGDFLEIPEAPAPEPEAPEEKQPEQLDAKPEPTEEEKKELAARNAQMYVTLVDLLVSRGCSLLTGGEIERYKLSKSEKEEYTKVSAEYFNTINATVSPAAVFIVSTLTIFSAIFFRAYLDYKQKKKKAEDEKRQREREAQREAAAAAAAEQQEREQREQERQPAPKFINKEPKPEPKKPLYYFEEFPEAKNSRSNFEIYLQEDKPENSKTWTDSLIGKYKRSPENDRWTYEECLKAEDNEPSPIIKMMIEQKLTEGKNWKTINLELRKFLRELPKMIDENE